MRLEGKRILVTGDASGIGRAVALQVAREGARVAATDVNEAAGAALIDEIAASGGTAYFWSADVTDEESVETMTGAAIEWLGGGIDVLLHVAGVLFGAGGDIRGFEESTWDAVVDVNLKGSYLVSKYASRPMLRDGKGVMVMTASGAPECWAEAPRMRTGRARAECMGSAWCLTGILGQRAFACTTSSQAT